MLLISLSTNNKYILRMNSLGKGASNSGLWVMIMCDLTLICLSHPNEPKTLFFFPCRISAKFYVQLAMDIYIIICYKKEYI